MKRLQVATRTHRIGSLFFNPGGPGGSAAFYVQGQADGINFFTNETLKHFDVIGMDSRGVGLSTPIKCDPNIWNERISFFPRTEADFKKMVNYNKRLGASCLNLSGPLLGFVDTESVARDFEAARIALGEGKLNFLAWSYGTQIASQYAELFPDNIRAMVLDGVLDHGLTETSMMVTEASTSEDVFKRFATYCETTPACALFSKNVMELFLQLLDKARIDPIPAPGCVLSGVCHSNVTDEDILFAVQPLLIFKVAPAAYAGSLGGWNDFGKAVADALAGDATPFSASIVTKQTSGSMSGLAIECLDWSHQTADSLAKLRYKYQLTSLIAPITGGGTQTYNLQARCVGWPMPVRNPMRVMNITTPTTLLLVNANHDPECSYVWANSLKEQIQNAVLLTREGDGHLSYMLLGETTKAIDAYLVNKTLPADNTVLYS